MLGFGVTDVTEYISKPRLTITDDDIAVVPPDRAVHGVTPRSAGLVSSGVATEVAGVHHAAVHKHVILVVAVRVRFLGYPRLAFRAVYSHGHAAFVSQTQLIPLTFWK